MKKTRGLIFVLCPVMIGVIRLLSSMGFYVVSGAGIWGDPTLLLAVKSFTNWLLGMLSLVSLVLMIVGIVLLVINKDIQITVKEAIGYGRENSKKHTKRFLLGFGIVIVLQVIESIINPQNDQTQSVTSTIVSIVMSILNLWIMFGLAKIALDIVYGRAYKIMSLFVGFKKTMTYVVAYIINMIVVIIWFLLFVFPGIIRSFRLSMTQYLILEKGYNPFKAIKMSWKMTKGFVGDIFAINLIGGLINMLWVLALLIGLIWTLPILMIANAYIYKKIAEINKDLIH